MTTVTAATPGSATSQPSTVPPLAVISVARVRRALDPGGCRSAVRGRAASRRAR